MTPGPPFTCTQGSADDHAAFTGHCPSGDGTFALVAAGEIDLSNVATFAAALTHAITQTVDDKPVTVDLSAVEYLDSGAINVLFNSADRVR